MTFINRIVYYQLKQHLDKPELSVILGPRQSGKTTVIRKIQDDLEKEGLPTVSLNLDIIEDRVFFTSQHTLLDYIEKKAGKRKVYVFIDEISRLVNAGLFLKGLYDLKRDHKFIITGSGSLELKADIIEPLTGRKKVFYCFPLSFTEFAAYKLQIRTNVFDHMYSEATRILITQTYVRKRLIQEYLHFGGYPRVALAQTIEEKTDVLKELYSSYIEKDIRQLLKVDREQAFTNLIRVLAGQVGNIVNRAELASTLGVTQTTIEKYLYLLEKTFVIGLVRPFYTNVRKELVKSPKVYFIDPGFLHIAQGILPGLEKQITGNVFENACWLRLTELNPLQPLQFWRTKSGAEVDFVMISQHTGKPMPVETKLSLRKNMGKSLLSFIEKYQPDEGYLYYLEGDHEDDRQVKNSVIHFLPYHSLPGKIV